MACPMIPKVFKENGFYRNRILSFEMQVGQIFQLSEERSFKLKMKNFIFYQM